MKNPAENPEELRLQPFQIQVSDADLADLRDRLRRTRFPHPGPVTGWQRGVPGPYLEDLVRYCSEHFDWRAQEASLNRMPQFTTEIEGQRLHFLHLRSPEPDALPIVLHHGWPGSFVEFARLVEPLADPRAYGGDPADAFHVVVPSLPGFGGSVPVTVPGWQATRTARALSLLMRRLGYARFGVHGSDVGAAVASALSNVDPGVVGVHASTDPQAVVTIATFMGDPATAPGLSETEREEVEALKRVSTDGAAYLQFQTTRPQTLAYGLTDSPAFQLAFMVEKFKEWTDPARDLPEEALARDQLITNFALYWFTGCGASAAHFLYENMQSREWGGEGKAPKGFAVFGARTFTRKLLDPERRYRHFNEFDRGGHFPAMEVPELLTADLRNFFRELRPTAKLTTSAAGLK